MLETVEFETEETETVNCEGCGIEVIEMDSFFSVLSNGCSNGNWIGESGYYCDDCYPRCFCPYCA